MEPLIKQGSFESIKASLPRTAGMETFTVGDEPSGPGTGVRTGGTLEAEFPKSKERWGLSLQSLRLNKELGGAFARWFDIDQEVYFLAWAWDLSGGKPYTYPAKEAPAEKCLIPMDKGELKLFLGQGISLWPLHQVTAGLNVKIMLWRCKQDTKDFGEAMVAVHDAIDKSDLIKQISALNTIAGPTGVALDAIEAAADALIGIVGKILASEKDEYLDYFEGNYAVSEPWETGPDNYPGKGASINLNRLADKLA
jgi:hypothetical protein